MSEVGDAIERISESDLHWLAGWLEGEGSFLTRGRSPRISGSSTDKDSAERVAKLLGVTCNGPYKKSGNRKDYWQAIADGYLAAAWMEKLKPIMGERRSAAIEMALAKARGRRKRLSQKEVNEILTELKRGWPQNILAKAYGVSGTAISHIKHGRTRASRAYSIEAAA